MRIFLTVLLLTLVAGCQSDIAIVGQKEVRVVVDSFIQPDQISGLDVLISLDTSGSMSDNYEAVSSGIELLRADIENLTLDYQLGYITMDPGNIGHVGPYDASSSAIDILMAPSLLPTTGLEQGFAATYTFLNSEEGVDFRREDSDFLLFLISDEDEQSSISATLFGEWLMDEFQNVQHDVVCVASPESTEDKGYGYDVGYKYIDLADLYGKDIVDIGGEQWAAWLSQSSYLTASRNYIILSEKAPIEGSIIVYINNEINYDWVYLSDSNSITFGETPSYGALVEVGYNVYI